MCLLRVYSEKVKRKFLITLADFADCLKPHISAQIFCGGNFRRWLPNLEIYKSFPPYWSISISSVSHFRGSQRLLYGWKFLGDPIFVEDPSLKISICSQMDIPELLHPQYPLGSASYLLLCVCHGSGSNLVRTGQKVVKNQQVINHTCT